MFCSSGCDEGGKVCACVCLFVCLLKRVSTGAPELTPPSEIQRRRGVCFCVYAQAESSYPCQDPVSVMSGELVCKALRELRARETFVRCLVATYQHPRGIISLRLSLLYSEPAGVRKRGITRKAKGHRPADMRQSKQRRRLGGWGSEVSPC